MAIEKYTTEGFILRQYEQGENDLVYKIWTEDFGVLFAVAKSIRKINAKLRMQSRKHDFIAFTIVKGKDVWRLVGVEELKETFLYNKKDLSVKKIIAESVDKFLEEKKPYRKLFQRMKSFFDLESDFINLPINKLKILIYYIVLVDTGYADAKIIGASSLEEYKSFSPKDFWTHFILNEEETKKHLLLVLKDSML
ncbi:MAG: hypothetical protein RI945_143 [Candidatus Parcubacteria bacterium]